VGPERQVRHPVREDAEPVGAAAGPKPPDWIFVGRLLEREKDAGVLGDPARLGDTMESVFLGLEPSWRET
jgi:hypothetical protein